MVNDTPMIAITHEDIAEGIEFWETALVGYIVGPMPKLATIRSFMDKHWGTVPRPQLLCLPSSWYVFRFTSKEDMETILHGGLG